MRPDNTVPLISGCEAAGIDYELEHENDNKCDSDVNGDNLQLSLERLYFEQRRQLFACALAVTRCPDLAEDAIHEAFCNLTRLRRAPDNLKAYTFRSVRNAALDQLRKNSRTLELIDDSIFDPAPGPAELARDGEFRERVDAALRRLGGDERETIVQHLYGELTFREIAEVRGSPLGTVTAWYRRGIEKLRGLLKE